MATAAVDRHEPLENEPLLRAQSQHTTHSRKENDDATQHTVTTAVDVAESVRVPQSPAEHHRPLATMQLVCTALVALFALYTLTMDITHARVCVCVHVIGVCHPLLCAAVQWLWHSEHSVTGANVVASCVAIAAVSLPQARQRAALFAHLCTVLAAQAYIIRRTRHMTMRNADGHGGTYARGYSPSITRFRNESVLRWYGGWSFASAHSGRSLGAVPAQSATSASAMDSAAMDAFGIRTAVEPVALPSSSEMDTARTVESDTQQTRTSATDTTHTEHTDCCSATSGTSSGTSTSNTSSATSSMLSTATCHSRGSATSTSAYDTSSNPSCTSSCVSSASGASASGAAGTTTSCSSTQMDGGSTASSGQTSDSSESSLYVITSIDKLAEDNDGKQRPTVTSDMANMLSVSPSDAIDVLLDENGDGASSMRVRNESSTQALAMLAKVPPCEQLSVAPARAIIPPKGHAVLAVVASVARPIEDAHITLQYAPVPEAAAGGSGGGGRDCKWMLQGDVPVASRRIAVVLSTDARRVLDRMRTAGADAARTAAAAKH